MTSPDRISEIEKRAMEFEYSRTQTAHEARALLRECGQALAASQVRVKELEAQVFVPGMRKCAKCGFVQLQAILRASDGAVGIKVTPAPEICPNGCGPLWQMTERDAGNDLCDQLQAAIKDRNESYDSGLEAAAKVAENHNPHTDSDKMRLDYPFRIAQAIRAAKKGAA